MIKKIYNNILELIGNTPVVKINKLVDKDSANIYVKLESFNPMGSVKDRIGLSMIIDAEKQGKIKPDDTLIEPTSGNTGIALAYVAAVKGYNLVLTMPESMSVERRKILLAFGAKIVLVKPEEGIGMTGAIKKADELAKENGWYQLKQFDNLSNPQIHRETTGKEILEQVPNIDAFVAGIGTGGTITGVGEYLKSQNKNIKIIGVEPYNSQVLKGQTPLKHKIQGIGAGFIPLVLNQNILDEIIAVKDEDAYNTTRKLAIKEGILAGISSGANLYAAIKVAKNLGKNKNIVVILPDTGERYLSTDLFNEVEENV